MDKLQEAAETFKRLLGYKYRFVIGRKGIKKEFWLDFDRADFHHLCGLHKLKDIAQLQQGMRSRVFDEILAGNITEELIEKSEFFSDMSMRIEPLSHLEEMLDNNELIFRYNEKVQKFSVIRADYLLEEEILRTRTFLFLGGREGSDIQMCRTFFPLQRVDYTEGQPKYTLLRKEKFNTVTGETETQYNRLS